MQSSTTISGTPTADLDADLSALALPLDFARTHGTPQSVRVHEFKLPAWGADERLYVTPAVLLACAFSVQLYRYSAQATIPLGLTRVDNDGRTRWSMARRIETEGSATTRDLLAQFASGVPRLEPEDISTCRARITYLRFSQSEELPNFTAIGRGIHADLNLVLVDGGPRAAFLYDERVLQPATVERFANHLCRLCDGLATRFDETIENQPMLGDDERAWLDELGEGPRNSFAFESVDRLFERQAEATPEAIAVRFGDEDLNYRTLNRRANQLARYLLERTERGGMVVVFIEPAVDIAVALLAILKAGAVYVPLDPTYPEVRIRAILEETRPFIVLTQAHLVSRLGELVTPCLLLDEASELDQLDDSNLELAHDPEQSAYIFYTSGTTGRPKGVLASHANLSAYIGSARDRYGFTRGDVMPAIARFSFSISMFELLSPLLSGGALVVLAREHVLDPARLAETLRTVTVFHAGPSLLRVLLPHIRRNYIDLSVFDGVRHASSGGDLIAPELLVELREIFRRAEVFVIYGCSEISCMGCTYPVPRALPIMRTYVGRPFDNTSVRVLDRALQRVPVGVVGEVHFSGHGVVKGYVDQTLPVGDKFALIDGRRYYRTGDLGRWCADGWLELLGRNDFQVKVRGMRIELGEVELTLRRAPRVRDAIVVARNSNGERGLVAYVVLDDGTPAAPDERKEDVLAAIRRYVSNQLPDYMVPAVYVELERMPLNHNMKLDRAALPPPPRPDERAASDPGLRVAETPTELRLAELFQRVLHIPCVSLDDNFFELGGDSLLATELIVAVERELSVRLEGMDVLRETLGLLAAICDQKRGAPARAPRPRVAEPTFRVTTFHFGRDSALHGVLHAPTGAHSQDAVLLCAPIGQERVRAGFVLTKLARQLASLGVPVLAFDPYGVGDSMGESVEATRDRWLENVADAAAELRRRHEGARLIGLGVRLGALLLTHALEHHDLSLTRLVLWDPVLDGAIWHAQLATMHRALLGELKYLRLGRTPRALPGAEELVGTTYSSFLLAELDDMRIVAPAHQPLTVKWLSSSPPSTMPDWWTAQAVSAVGSRHEVLSLDAAWNETGQLNELLPDTGLTQALVNMVTES